MPTALEEAMVEERLNSDDATCSRHASKVELWDLVNMKMSMPVMSWSRGVAVVHIAGSAGSKLCAHPHLPHTHGCEILVMIFASLMKRRQSLRRCSLFFFNTLTATTLRSRVYTQQGEQDGNRRVIHGPRGGGGHRNG